MNSELDPGINQGFNEQFNPLSQPLLRSDPKGQEGFQDYPRKHNRWWELDFDDPFNIFDTEDPFDEILNL